MSQNNDPLNNQNSFDQNNNNNNNNNGQNNQNFNNGQNPNYYNGQNPNFQQGNFGQNNMPPNYNQKSKVAAGLLGIFLGSLGVHNFYLGYTGKAVAQLLITVLSCFILSIVSSIWGLVEGIIILSSQNYYDGNGMPLRN